MWLEGPKLFLSEVIMKSESSGLGPWSNHMEGILNGPQEVILFRSQVRKSPRAGVGGWGRWKGENLLHTECRGDTERERELGRLWREKSNLPDEVGFLPRRPEKAVSNSEARSASSPGGFHGGPGCPEMLEQTKMK